MAENKYKVTIDAEELYIKQKDGTFINLLDLINNNNSSDIDSINQQIKDLNTQINMVSQSSTSNLNEVKNELQTNINQQIDGLINDAPNEYSNLNVIANQIETLKDDFDNAYPIGIIVTLIDGIDPFTLKKDSAWELLYSSNIIDTASNSSTTMNTWKRIN